MLGNNKFILTHTHTHFYLSVCDVKLHSLISVNSKKEIFNIFLKIECVE